MDSPSPPSWTDPAASPAGDQAARTGTPLTEPASSHAPSAGLRLAIVGAGPVGLALALLASRLLPLVQISLFDARPLSQDLSHDPRTLALALGSVQLLQRLGAWPDDAAQPIDSVHVSQAPPTVGRAAVRISAREQGVPMLGAVLSYGALVSSLQRAWLAEAAAHPGRLHPRFGSPVAAVLDRGDRVEVDAGIVEAFDLAVVAEGGVFADQARKALAHDYRQAAWVGTVALATGTPGMAFERFTRHGPLALLPLQGRSGSPSAAATPASSSRAALVWCVPADDDPVASLSDEQRRQVLSTLLPPEAGRLVEVSPLKRFALGLNAERSLVQGRQVRIGNAAQTLHPVAGQGLNLGLRDAFALVDALRFAPDVPAALRRVEWQRAPDRWSTIATTDFLARSFTWQWPGVATARGLALAALEAAGPLKAALARQMMFGSR